MSQLRRDITLYGLTMIAIGSCIGSGIFITPAQIASVLPSHIWILIVWSFGGLIALTGALTFAELGGIFPKSGGVYVFLKEAYGDIFGFLYGWVYLLVVNTGALAALSVVFTEYLTFFVDLGQTDKLIVSIVVIIGLTIVNMAGVNWGQIFINLFTGLKLIAIILLVGCGVLFMGDTSHEISFSFSDPPDNLMSAFFLALIGVFWSFGGWHHASFVAAETKNAVRNVPRAMIIGVGIVTLAYVLTNLAYMLLLPISEIAGSERVAGNAMEAIALFKGIGGKIAACMIAISIFGTIAIYTMSAPRVYYAMAKDGLFFKSLAYVHPKFKTPVYAMGFQAIWAVLLLIFWQRFSDLITYVTFMDLLFMMLAGASIFVFRRKLKSTERPYKTLGYPVVPIIFVIVTGIFVINTFIERPSQTIAGLIITVLGVVMFYYFKRIRRVGE